MHVHFTATHASWLNQVEQFSFILDCSLLHHGEFDSLEHLADRVIVCIKYYIRRAVPFPMGLRRPPTKGRVNHGHLGARALPTEMSW